MPFRFLFLPFAISATSLLHAEKTAKEWQEELGRAYSEAGGFVASYSGESPGNPALQVLVIEDRERQSAFLKITLGDDESLV